MSLVPLNKTLISQSPHDTVHSLQRSHHEPFQSRILVGCRISSWSRTVWWWAVISHQMASSWSMALCPDVISQIKTIATQFDGRLVNDERNLLSIAYKNKTNTLRNSWRIVDTLEKMQAARTAPGTTTRQLTLIRQQRKKIERELANVCKDIVKLLEKQLLPAARYGEERVFYSKMYMFSVFPVRCRFDNKSTQERRLLSISSRVCTWSWAGVVCRRVAECIQARVQTRDANTGFSTSDAAWTGTKFRCVLSR